MATRNPSTHCDFYVYALFRENGVPFYVGKGSGNRCYQHTNEAKAGKRGYRFNIIRDMLKRGVEMPVVKLYEGLTEAAAHEYEIALIAAIRRHPHGPLTNLTNGGEGASGFKHAPRMRSAEHSANLSTALRGRTFSPEWLANMAAAQLGKKQTPEHIENAAATRRGKTQTLEHVEKRAKVHRGRKATSEARANQAAAHLGKKRSAESCAKQAETQRGRLRSVETKAKISATLIGHQVSYDTRAKIAATLLRRTERVKQDSR